MEILIWSVKWTQNVVGCLKILRGIKLPWTFSVGVKFEIRRLSWIIKYEV